MNYLDLKDKTILVFGVGNKRSVAYRTATILEEAGAKVIYSVRSNERRESLSKLLEGREVHVCDLEHDDRIASLATAVGKAHPVIHGILHSVAFANFENFSGKFHEVSRKDFLQAVSVSCYSLVAVANAFKDLLDRTASVVTISISTTSMAAESYGYLAPAKAALDSSIVFLAKSFGRISEVRFNAVRAGLLKTNSSAGIPGYVDNYLYAERVIPRRRAVETDEVANAAAFLLSPRSSGINAQGIVVDGGMAMNYFDADVVRATVAQAWPTEGT